VKSDVLAHVGVVTATHDVVRYGGNAVAFGTGRDNVIGVCGGAMPFGRLIRIERGSLLRLTGETEVPSQELPRWVTLKQAANYYQVSPNLIRRILRPAGRGARSWAPPGGAIRR
jgi:hypothetical protein